MSNSIDLKHSESDDSPSKEQVQITEPTYLFDEKNDRGHSGKIVSTAEDIVANVLALEDDPTENPWTFRMWFLGLGLAIFGSVLQGIFYFKPQTFTVYLTGSYVAYMITTNMSLTAGIVHLLLFNYDDLKAAWEWAHPSRLRKRFVNPNWYKFWQSKTDQELEAERQAYLDDPLIDPHYKLILKNEYKPTPLWWWGALTLIAWVVGVVCLYQLKSTLPWWGFLLSTLFTLVFLLFFGAQNGITGFAINMQPVCQMLGGYLFPGRPFANFYFTCYSYNALGMGLTLSRDLKLAQYSHLSSRCAFTVQIVSCLVGALMNYVMMISIVQNQAEILKSILGTNIWSGQNIQQFNTLALSWSMAKDLYSIGSRYQWVTIGYLIGFLCPVPFYIMHRLYPKCRAWTYINTSIIMWYMGFLVVGANASVTMYFIIGFIAQFWVRRYKPELFIKYNYIMSAALDGGTQVLVFIFTFAIFGGSGKAVIFPTYVLNPASKTVNGDYCMVNPYE